MIRPWTAAGALCVVLSACSAFYPDGQVDVDGDGRTPEQGDCDDRNADIHPGAVEECDGIDNDCDGAIDGEDTDIVDADGDGFDGCEDCDDTRAGVSPDQAEVCDGFDTDCDGELPPDEADADEDGAHVCDGDCDDSDPTRSPLIPEVCDGIDTDCDGLLPGDDPDIPDADQDGVRVCADCDDDDDTRTPGAPELCDGIDNDCFMGVPSSEADTDGDLFLACAGDCDDEDPNRNPEAIEVCNGIDDQCRGGLPLDEQDPDSDTWFACQGDCRPLDQAIHPGATEACNGEDDDCDGLVDEPDPAGVPAHVATGRTDGALDLWEVSGGLLLAPFASGGALSSAAFPVGAADLDGDGVVDFLRAELDLSDSTVDAVDRVSLQCAGGWAAEAVAGVSLPDDRRIEAIADLDGDGAPDLIAVRHDDVGAGELYVQMNDGFGGFAAPIAAGQLTSASLGPGTWRVPSALVDLDGDSLPDMLECGDLDHRTCRVHSGLGDGTFDAPGPAFVLGSAVEALAAGDADGDGLADLVFGLSAGFDPGALHVASGDGLGAFSGEVEVLDVEPAVEFGQGPAAGRGWVRLSDVDGDLVLDLAVLWDTGVDGADRALAIALGDGVGGFTLGSSQPLISASLDAAGPDGFAAMGP